MIKVYKRLMSLLASLFNLIHHKKKKNRLYRKVSDKNYSNSKYDTKIPFVLYSEWSDEYILL